MKRFKKQLALLIVILAMPALTGCNTVYSNYRELQQLLVIQTLGLDKSHGGVTVSMAAAAEANGTAPKQICAQGGTIATAIDRAYRQSYEQEIFFSHANHLLIGEQAAEDGIDSFLDYLCQSATLRIDMPLYIVTGGTANEAVTKVGDDERGISEVMESVKETFASPSNSHVFTVADTVKNLQRYGSALTCAVAVTESSETSGADGETTFTAAPSGYAVIRDGRLCKLLSYDQGLAIGLMLGSVPIRTIEVKDMYGKASTLEIETGSADIKPIWAEDGGLQGLELKVEVEADLIESGTAGSDLGADYLNHLTAQLEASLSEQISQLLKTSRSLRADFLGLAGSVERSSPERYAALTQSFPELLPSLELQLTVSGSLRHTNDMKEQ